MLTAASNIVWACTVYVAAAANINDVEDLVLSQDNDRAKCYH